MFIIKMNNNQKRILSIKFTAYYILMTLMLVSCNNNNQSEQTASSAQNADSGLDRTVLPITGPSYPADTTLDARNTKAPARFDVKAPAKAPNVIVVLIDDIGFGQSSAFGGPINMPAADKIAAAGIRYNNFHTTALCSPTRVALLTGYNHHSNNAGAIMELATGFPGNTGIRPYSITTMAEVLRQNGYSTSAFGKYHETPPWEVSVSGPFDRWPTHSGFDKFYGFIGGETNMWSPMIYDGTAHAEIPQNDPSYNFNEDMADKSINWMRYQQSLTPDKPFFMYYAPGATHAPHHVPKEWIAKYKGKFDQGWDKIREETLARQIKMGIVPPNTVLAPKPKEIKDWDKLSADEKKLFAHQMEVFAAFAEYTDYEIGRLHDAVDSLGELNNTLFIYIIGDNGASAEGGMNGMFNEMTYFNGVPETVDDQIKKMDELGGPNTFPHYSAGWAVAGDAPFGWTKQEAGTFGGTTNPLIMSWPGHIKPDAKVRHQFHHVIDIAPTIYQAIGIPVPKIVNGVEQQPIQGVSMVYTWDSADAPSTHSTQYFEIFGNRGIYSDGWFAGTVHRAPWEYGPRHPLNEDVWELYNTNTDFSQANDSAAANPQKLNELKNLFTSEAIKYHVLPIDDRTLERLVPKLAGRPDLIGDRISMTLYPGMVGMMENAFINMKNKSFTITADIEGKTGNANGVLLCQGGKFGGWVLYLKNGKPMFTYNYLGLSSYTVAGKVAIKGKSRIVFDFSWDGPKPGAGGLGKIFVNGKMVAQNRIDKTQGYIFSADETADVGVDDATHVADYGKESEFRGGTIDKIVLSIKPSSPQLSKQQQDSVQAEEVEREYLEE
jgi:arylsulfatase A-like enzyme